MALAAPEGRSRRADRSLAAPAWGTARQFLEKAQTFGDETWVGPLLGLDQRFVAPIRSHVRERPERVRRGWRAPEPTEKLRDHEILLGFWDRAQNRTRHAALKQHGAKVVVRFKQLHGRISVPEAQAMDLVLTFHVRHPELQDCGAPVGPQSWGHPCATHLFTIERRAKRERPPVLQIAQSVRESLEPCCAPDFWHR